MVSRRRILQATSSALLAAAAGCSADSAGRTDTSEPTSTTQDSTTSDDPRVETPRLAANVIRPETVPAGATVGVTTPSLYELVVEASASSDRVDLRQQDGADPDETLALGQFAYVAFRDDTYEATASFADFGDESAQQYELVRIDESVDGNGTAYGALSEAEQTATDRLLNGSITVGRHENEHPDGVRALVAHDYVRVGNDTYEPQVVVSDPPAHHMLRLVDAAPPADAQVVTVADRAPDLAWTDTFETAMTDGTARIDDTPSGDALREYVNRVDYLVGVSTAAEVTVVETSGAN